MKNGAVLMRAVVQRVCEATVIVEKKLISRIGKGLLVFLGVERGDAEEDADYLLEKITHLRIFEDAEQKMNLSVSDIGGQILVVSQFTLLADCRKGRRPSFTEAEEPLRAKTLYEYFLSSASGRMKGVASGEFQASMKVELVNDGPVTMILDSRRRS
ncbi:MAG TPA: D-aminoacyl-tRNA deacylase [Syntrophales bacterium]|nr:D-aminoacyl-tRNA deacylase [Syntrophales bacterium]